MYEWKRIWDEERSRWYDETTIRGKQIRVYPDTKEEIEASARRSRLWNSIVNQWKDIRERDANRE